MDVGDQITTRKGNWSFSGAVAAQFDTHVRKSIPLYDQGHELICQLSEFFCRKDSICYDLGCSTGQLLRKLAQYNHSKPEVAWIGLDREDAMIRQAKKDLGDSKIKFLCEDFTQFDFQKADLIIAYYSVQFLPEKLRQPLLDRIYQSLNWGGALILFEKVRAPDARFQDMMGILYHEFKLRQGFSGEEIFNKNLSLKGILNPFSTEGNLGLLRRAGFVDIMSVMKYVCFEGFLAVK